MTSEIFPVCVIGSGLAGSECAWQLAKRGIRTALIEMRPAKSSPAHHTDKAAELVCSNSLRSNDVMNAVGLIKEEMAALDSLVVRAAYKSRVPAGSALAVDRDAFADFVTARLSGLECLVRIAGEALAIENEGDAKRVKLASGEAVMARHVVIATGPLTADPLSKWIAELAGRESLYFYDAIAPIVEKDSIDMNVAFLASRWGKGESEEGDYVNCPMEKPEYEAFVTALQNAELVEVHDFDKAQFFEACLPIEVMAARGMDVLNHGPMKPVGLRNPHSQTPQPYAVVQLRQDNLHGSLYNMVGFQTRMKWGEQQRIFRMIPGLETAEFVRLGSMHRNTYLCSPVLLREGMELKNLSGLHFAGQITGCEGYVESAAIGLYVGSWLAKCLLERRELASPPKTTAMGALIRHILKADPSEYQPMNVNFGLFEPLEKHFAKTEKKAEIVKRATADFRKWIYDDLE